MIDWSGNGNNNESKSGISIKPLYDKPLPKVNRPRSLSTVGGIIMDKSSVEIKWWENVSIETESDVESI